MLPTQRIIVAAISDTHGGHKLGLCNPAIELTTETGNKYKPELTEAQKYLWEIYEKAIQETMIIAGKSNVYLFHLGDQTQGNKYINEQMTTRISDQFFIGESNLLPWLSYKNVKSIRLVKGTPSHVFGEGTSDITIEGLLTRRFPNKDIRALYHGLANINGIGIDYAHHGPNVGSRNWLKGNEARYYLRSLMMDEINVGCKPPHIVMRGHYHDAVVEYLRVLGNETWFSVIPSMCMLGDFGHMASKSTYRITNGIIVYEVINGKVNPPIELTETIDIRTKEDI